MKQALVGAAVAALLLIAPTSQAQAVHASDVVSDHSDPLREGAHDVVIDGVRIWYRVAGTSGIPVIFLHGGPGSFSHDFATLAGPALETSLRMVYLDQRGSGHSERPWTGEYSILRLVEDIEGVRQVLRAPRIALIGHSFGGALALEYGAKYPNHVSRLVLVGGLSDAAASGRTMCRRLAETNPVAYARAAADSANRSRPGGCNVTAGLQGADLNEFFMANMYPDPAVRTVRDSVARLSGLRNTGELQRALFAQGLLTYEFSAHQRLTMPVLIIAGQRDYQIGLEAQEELARRLPRARLVVYESGGHHMYLDEPERFSRDVRQFLASGHTSGRLE